MRKRFISWSTFLVQRFIYRSRMVFIQLNLEISWCFFKTYWNFSFGKKRVDSNLVVCMTTVPSRFKFLERTLKSLLVQDLKPHQIRIYIENYLFETLYWQLLKFSRFGVKVLPVTPGLRAANKYIPELESLNSEELIVYVDDDVAYPKNLLSSLVRSSSRYLNSKIICNWAQVPSFSESSEPLPYKNWEDATIRKNRNSRVLIPLGVAGVLLPRKIFPRGVLDRIQYQRLSLENDDLWLFAHAVLEGVPVNLNQEFVRNPVLWPGSQIEALWKINVEGGRNDEIFMKLLHEYPSLKSRILSSLA